MYSDDKNTEIKIIHQNMCTKLKCIIEYESNTFFI